MTTGGGHRPCRCGQVVPTVFYFFSVFSVFSVALWLCGENDKCRNVYPLFIGKMPFLSFLISSFFNFLVAARDDELFPAFWPRGRGFVNFDGMESHLDIVDDAGQVFALEDFDDEMSPWA